jgi:hypothetical protein
MKTPKILLSVIEDYEACDTIFFGTVWIILFRFGTSYKQYDIPIKYNIL